MHVSNISWISLREKSPMPKSFLFFLWKNICCQNFSMFSREKMPVSNISWYFPAAKLEIKKIIVVLPIQNTDFLNLPLNPMLKEKTLFTDNCLLIAVWHHFIILVNRLPKIFIFLQILLYMWKIYVTFVADFEREWSGLLLVFHYLFMISLWMY